MAANKSGSILPVGKDASCARQMVKVAKICLSISNGGENASLAIQKHMPSIKPPRRADHVDYSRCTPNCGFARAAIPILNVDACLTIPE